MLGRKIGIIGRHLARIPFRLRCILYRRCFYSRTVDNNAAVASFDGLGMVKINFLLLFEEAFPGDNEEDRVIEEELSIKGLKFSWEMILPTS